MKSVNQADNAHIRAIGAQTWQEVFKNGLPGYEVNVQDWPQSKLASLWNALSALNIQTQMVQSSLQGQKFVVRALGGDNILKIGECIEAHKENSSLLTEQFWLSVDSTNGGSLNYLPLSGLSPFQTNSVQSALRFMDIDYEFKTSSLDGGMEVLAVRQEDFQAAVSQNTGATKPVATTKLAQPVARTS